MQLPKNLMLDCCGASASEYALILAVIGGAIAIAAITLGGAISSSMTRAKTQIEGCGGGC